MTMSALCVEDSAGTFEASSRLELEALKSYWLTHLPLRTWSWPPTFIADHSKAELVRTAIEVRGRNRW